MRILYGVAGEGMGHATRSRVVIEELAGRHDVRVVTSSDAFDYLTTRVPVEDAVWRLDEEGSEGRETYRRLEAFRPDVVLTDLEPLAARFALRRSLPLVSIDHLHAIDRCRHDPGLVRGHEGELWLSRQRAGAEIANAAHYVISTFFYPLLLEPRTTLVPPILRPEVLAARAEPGDHLLVYQSGAAADRFSAALSSTGIPCRIYGLRPDLDVDVVEGNLVYRPFSEKGFVDDLRTSLAVVSAGSFTLIGEALFLGKPVLATPTRGHFGHLLNGLYLERLGYGRRTTEVTPAVLDSFLAQLPALRGVLDDYEQVGNDDAFATVGRVLGEVVKNGRRRPTGRVATSAQ